MKWIDRNHLIFYRMRVNCPRAGNRCSITASYIRRKPCLSQNSKITLKGASDRIACLRNGYLIGITG